ncbi:MAG: hypothetical protein IT336_14530, partial [Thermomicrobiales bacterium]|nr:hypothetical protein [Thermomicrobiales bacterium]
MSTIAGAPTMPVDATRAIARERKRPGFWRRFTRHKLAFAGLIFLAFIGAAALLTPVVSPYDAYDMN